MSDSYEFATHTPLGPTPRAEASQANAVTRPAITRGPSSGPRDFEVERSDDREGLSAGACIRSPLTGVLAARRAKARRQCKCSLRYALRRLLRCLTKSTVSKR